MTSEQANKLEEAVANLDPEQAKHAQHLIEQCMASMPTCNEDSPGDGPISLPTFFLPACVNWPKGSFCPIVCCYPNLQMGNGQAAQSRAFSSARPLCLSP